MLLDKTCQMVSDERLNWKETSQFGWAGQIGRMSSEIF